ncbi:3-oxoacid CoA-transferase subunit B [Tardiphaga sp.]|uniref:3-oxoacid CoA-transferase subunit B n=1 Tax=Tardiphaga sp. TaxID=1926292 RepID=UPI0026180C12|nr:3-oxoacid CoA-transferase subunit B [Tardiphaga sp.]MDB5620172.1 3-oxoadipate CoA-transferase [Tardiphaga sp.]
MTIRRLTRDEIARAVAQDIPDGSYVNLGIGIPTLVAKHLPDDREIVLHSENGIVGMRMDTNPQRADTSLLNAGKQQIVLLAGASIIDHTISFAMMRGGHIDITVLGAFQVSETGDIANWDTGDANSIPAVGGAMDLVVGARRVIAVMEHITKEGAPKLVDRCSYPLTGMNVVDTIYTDLAILDVRAEGFVVRAVVDGLSLDELQKKTGARLHASGGEIKLYAPQPTKGSPVLG